MTEHGKLAGKMRFVRCIDRSKMIAAMFLPYPLDPRVALPPLFGDYAATMVRGRLFEAWRFCVHELAQNGEHFREAGLEDVQEFSAQVGIQHCADMPATA